jgi:hypothetical protein
MFSADGRRLLFIRGNRDAGPPGGAAHEIQVWDLASRELLRSTAIGSGRLAATRDRRHLFEVNQDGRIRVIDSDSLTAIEEARIPESLGQVVLTEGRDPMFVVTAAASRNTVHVVSGGRIIHHWPDTAGAHLSSDGRRLFLCRYETETGISTTEIFEVRGAAFTPSPQPSFPGRVIASDSRGDVVLVVNGPAFTVRNVPEEWERAWKPAAPWGQVWGISISAKGDFVYSTHESGVSATFDVKSGTFTRAMRLEQLSEALYVSAVSPDDRLMAGAIGDQPVRIWDVATGQLVARLGDHRPLRFGLGAAYLGWCLLWIASGLRAARPRPWLDVLVVNGPLIAVLMVHAATRPRWEIHPAVIAVCLGMLTGLMGMLILWWIHGKLRWSLRLAGMIAGTATIAAGVLGSGHRADPGVWNIMVGALSYIGLLALLLKWQRWRGRTVARGGMEVAAPAHAVVRWQAPLRDLLTLTAAVALLLGVMRFAVPGIRDGVILAYVTVLGAGLAATVFVAMWAALSPSRIWPVIPVILAAAIDGALPLLFFGAVRSEPLWWLLTLHGVAAATVFLSLGVFRLHGYRLGKEVLRTPAEAPLRWSSRFSVS